MRLQTIVPVDQWSNPIGFERPILLIGSCFSEHIAERLRTSGFSTRLNPYGISFNPLSIVQGLHDILDERSISASELVEREGVWNHWGFHSSWSGVKQEEVASGMNASIQGAHADLSEASHLMITLGTSWVYCLKETGEVVNNCHKFPGEIFDRRRLDGSEIRSGLNEVIERLKEFNPDLKILFTLSPVRHWKDGAEENAVSKAILRVAIDDLCEAHEHCDYFPAFEIMMDELRDYRFYADDLLHPNTMAQVIIWERFTETAMTEADQVIAQEVQAYHRMLSHRSLHPGSSADNDFKESIEKRRTELKARYPQVHLP